ncbi:mRNA-capping enzyme [Pseudocercospora fuligena]|uniref:mRNA-capping enzyme n=1 Tax=Pseudocercospora fuligena TaxID=685502 RepID=A0A8H6VLH2_9PEZI|nr:mRNA-capping enzyme [Pseudocercospora fuligena]
MEKTIFGRDSPRWAIAATGLGVTAGLVWWLNSTYDLTSRFRIQTAAETDPGLLKKGTNYERYETRSGIVYPRIRTFYNVHAQAKKLPKDVPLLVFMHGLGGSIAQFEKLLASLTQVATCLAIDLPGCGLSDFEPRNVEAYTTVAFAELLYAAIDRYRDKENDQKVILIGHSIGCSISALLTASTSPLADLCSDVILGMVGICPRANPPSEEYLNKAERLTYLPSLVFDMIRMYDRKGGTASISVTRVIGEEADLETKKLQLRFNQQSKSRVFQNFAAAIVKQEREAKQRGEDSLLGRRIWDGIEVPLFLVAADNDKLAPPDEVNQIVEWLTNSSTTEEIAPETAVQQPPRSVSPLSPRSEATMLAGHFSSRMLEYTIDQPAEAQSTEIKDENKSSKHSAALKASIFPAPSSHGLLYDQGDVRILSRMIEEFLAKHVDKRLSPSWQLQHLTTSGKWDVKNLEKWKKIQPCSDPIAGVFRAMKTMREVDEIHCPKEFVKKYSWKAIPNGVAVVVDISFDTPVYDKAGLIAGEVEYHKIPTVSKLPPNAQEVENFVTQIDGLRKDLRPGATIGVHCHYGFNRTGFLIVCYLVERLGWKLEDAIEEFKEKRAPGIKHEHFVDELYLRYRANMTRRATILGGN